MGGVYPAHFRPVSLTNRVPLNRDGQVRRTSGSDALPLLRLIWSVTMGFDIKNLFERKITMKKTLAKILALALCAVLLVTGTVFVTLAYLQDSTGVVRNTFSSSNITITLDELRVDENGVPRKLTSEEGSGNDQKAQNQRFPQEWLHS